MTLTDHAAPPQATGLPGQQLSLSFLARGLLVAIALWLIFSGIAAHDVARLPLSPEGVRAAIDVGISGRAIRLTFDAIVSGFGYSSLLVALVLVGLARGEKRMRTQGSGIAMLVLAAAVLGAGTDEQTVLWLAVLSVAALVLGWLVSGEAGKGRGVLIAIALGLAGMGAAYALITTFPALLPPDAAGWDGAFRSPLILLPWIPLPFAVAYAAWRGGLWMLERPSLSLAMLRSMAAGALLGALVGSVALGAGSRLSMRGIALAAGIPTGFSTDGTLVLLALGVVLGACLGTIHLALRERIPGGRWRGLLVGAVLWLLIVVLMVQSAGTGELVLAPLWVSIALFSFLPFAYSLLLEALCSKVLPLFPPATRERPLLLGLYALLATGGVLSLVILIGFSTSQ